MLSQNMSVISGCTPQHRKKDRRISPRLRRSQDYDLVLRCSRETAPERIHHIPQILYHWRAIESSTATDSGMKPYAWDAAGAQSRNTSRNRTFMQ